MIIYFTGTGNSRYVAQAIGDRLKDQVVDAFDYIRDKKSGDFVSANPWIFVFPVYLSTIARLFNDFIRRSTFGGNDKAYFVATCASAMGSSPNYCREIAESKGLKYMGTARVQMPQNYIALFKMTPKEECERRLDAALKEADIIAQVISNEETLDGKLTSSLEYKATCLVETWYNSSFTSTKKFYATKSCVGCGMCERKCPTKTITMVEGKPKWSGNCSHCMACINGCPKAAIEYGKGTASKERYICKPYEKLV